MKSIIVNKYSTNYDRKRYVLLCIEWMGRRMCRRKARPLLGNGGCRLGRQNIITNNQISQTMNELREKAINVIVNNLNNYTNEMAAEELDASVRHLQELTCMNDYRTSDLRNEVEGLCGFLSNDIARYMTVMMYDENIPDSIKEQYTPIDEEAENEFNPYEYVGLLGEDMCNEYMEMAS